MEQSLYHLAISVNIVKSLVMAKNKYIETPEKMWEYFLMYKKELKANPIYIFEQKKGNTIIPKNYDGEIDSSVLSSTVELPVQRPLTMEGFENWLFMAGIISDVSDYFENKDSRYSEYLPICRAIKRMIRQDQIEGGMAGIYNPSITQRLNNLTERVENKNESVVSGKVVIVSPNSTGIPLSNSEKDVSLD